jgi:hypothetical protein
LHTQSTRTTHLQAEKRQKRTTLEAKVTSQSLENATFAERVKALRTENSELKKELVASNQQVADAVSHLKQEQAKRQTINENVQVDKMLELLGQSMSANQKMSAEIPVKVIDSIVNVVHGGGQGSQTLTLRSALGKMGNVQLDADFHNHCTLGELNTEMDRQQLTFAEKIAIRKGYKSSLAAC